jgi:hypothetical protein
MASLRDADGVHEDQHGVAGETVFDMDRPELAGVKEHENGLAFDVVEAEEVARSRCLLLAWERASLTDLSIPAAAARAPSMVARCWRCIANFVAELASVATSCFRRLLVLQLSYSLGKVAVIWRLPSSSVSPPSWTGYRSSAAPALD